METASLDASLEAQIDTYITDDTTISSPTVSSGRGADRDSIARDKERLQRFHKEAMSFLTKAYSNDDTVLVEDRFDNAAAAARSADDFLAQRRVELDRIRLERFHAQAVSFLDRAYADEPGTIVVEEALSPGATAAAAQDREMLQRFHEEAMNFLDAAAGGSPGLGDTSDEPGVERAGSTVGRRRADRTSIRIERDKARLEQHYQEAMSFLDRAEAEEKGVLVEEQELESAVVERFKLQKYAQDAMSFLDKAFRNDASIMVGDEEELSTDGGDEGRGNVKLVESGEEGVRDDDREGSAASAAQAPDGGYSQRASSQGDEDRQIAADRAALERYDEEFGDFLSKAYLDDSTVIVEDADSETSGTERGLFARRMAPSTTSADTGYSGSATLDEDFSEEAYTDDEFQDPEVAESSQLEILRRSLPAESPRYSGANPDSSGDGVLDDGNENVRRRLMRYEQEAADILEGTNVSVDEDEDEDDDDGEYPRPTENNDSADGDQSRHGDEDQASVEQDDGRHVLVEEDDDDDEEFGADQHIDDETIPRAFYDDEGVSEDRESSPSEFEVQSSRFPDRVEMPRTSSAREGAPTRSPESQDLLVDVILEDNTGRSQEWSQVPLEKSFYRQVPRGSTIKIRPLVSPQLSTSSHTGTNGTNDSLGPISLSELQRVEKERDALMAALEEIVNERSMLAAQVSEMKAMIQNAGGMQAEQGKSGEELEDIDLAAELQDAHDTMSKLTEEMEVTLGVLDNRYQETLERAHKAEERCIRLESSASRLEKEFSKQGVRLSQALAEQSRLTSLLSKSDRELETLRKKSESDMKRLDDSHREELDRSVGKILELTNEVSNLQQKVKSGSSSSADRRLNSPSRKMEVEMAGLKRRLAEMDRRLGDERASHKKKLESEVHKMKVEREREVQKLSVQVERLGQGVREGESAKRELRKVKMETSRMSTRAQELELSVEDLQRALKEAKRGQVAAEAEAQHVRTRYEESLKKRISRMDQKAEMLELQAALNHLKEEAGSREQKLQQQLSEFRSRSEQAEAAASRAERDAKEAAEAAKLAQERGRAAVEAERKARKTAEAERQVAARECKEWEKAAQQQRELNARSDDSSGGLVKTSSRRGLRRSPSKGGVKEAGKKKREHAKGGGSEDGGKKKSSMRPRLFG